MVEPLQRGGTCGDGGKVKVTMEDLVEEHLIEMGKIVMVEQLLLDKATTEVISLVALINIITRGVVAQELLVEMERQLEEVMVETGYSLLLQEQQRIMPVVGVVVHVQS